MNNKDLIDSLKREGTLTSERIEEALTIAKREYFVKEKYSDVYYSNRPLPIGYGQTISQPTVVVKMTQLLDPNPGDKILEIGAGSGWQSALLSVLVGEEGHVYTMERKPELVDQARNNLRNAGFKNVTVLEGDGSLGCEEYAVYDKIICTAACPNIPDVWIEQLKTGGKIIAPVGSRNIQSLVLYRKEADGLDELEKEYGYRFVPLLGKKGFKDSKRI